MTNNKELTEDCQELIKEYRTLFQEEISDKEPVINYGRAIKQARPHIKNLGLKRMLELLEAYFQTDDEFFRKNSWDIYTFLSYRVIHRLHIDTK